MDTLEKILNVNFLGYAHCFMSIRISQMKDHSISVDQARYSTSLVEKYLDTATVKASKKYYIRPHCHLILYSQKMIHKPVMIKLRS